MIHTQANDKKPHFGPDLGPLDPNSGRQNVFIKLVFTSSSKLSSFAI